MKHFISYPTLILALVALTSGCRDLRSSTGAPEVTPEIVLRGEEALRVRFGGEIRRLLAAGRYDSLESIAEALRKPDARWASGGWKLRTYYYQGFDESLDKASEQEWQSHLMHLRQWRLSSPRSITAPVALANALVGYAWMARGSGSGREVSDSGWRRMRSRLEEARSVLIDARKLPRACPGWWAAAQRVALGEGWNREIYEELFREAVRVEPTFDAYYELKALHLLPRWHGRQGEWEVFADSIADQLPPPLGDQHYARIVWFVQRYIGENVFEETQASWDRTKRGYEELVKAYPSSLELRSAFAYLAWQAADQPTARQQFVELGPRIDPGVWEDRPEFMEARKWAFTE
jgi:hypothetical protein